MPTTMLMSIAAASAVALLAGCSAPSTPLVPGAVRSAVAEAANSQMAFARSTALRSSGVPFALYVADPGSASVDILHNSNYRAFEFIIEGINDPFDVFLDSQSNLYVANYSAGDVTEYAPNTGVPFFTYSSGMVNPAAVTVDASGDLYDADPGSGTVNEYRQGVNQTVFTCFPGGTLGGIAVDAFNNVFTSVGTSHVEEYKGGLGNGCRPATLRVKPPKGLGFSGIALDKHRNLLVAAESEVLVIDAPSYSAVNSTIGSGFGCAVNVRLNKSNTLAFVTDPCDKTVTVVSYPSGANLKVLGSANGLDAPNAAVDWPNAVY